MPYAKGCKPPNPVKLASHPKASAHPVVAARATGPLPASADKLPPRKRVDQGNGGLCTAASTTIAVYTALESKGDPLGFDPSQLALYAPTRAEERAAATPDGSPLPPLTDSGADLETVFPVMASYGLKPMRVQASPDGRFCDVWTDADTGGNPPGNINDEPSATDLMVASETPVQIDLAPHTIQPLDPNASDLMAAALSADQPLPILVAGWVDNAFEQLQPGQVAPAPNQANGGGGHAFWLSAYRTNAAGAREWKVENSWGLSWCENGAGWVSDAFVQSLWALYVLDVRKVAPNA